MWNLKYSNSPCHDKERLSLHKDHLERLLQVKDKIDNHRPITPIFLRIKANKVQNERNTKTKLKYENGILFNRMHSILNKPSYYNFDTYKPQYCPAYDKARFDWQKKQSQIDIDKRNTQLYNRFNETKTCYPIASIDQQADFYQYLERNINKKQTNPNIYYIPFRAFQKKVMGKLSEGRGIIQPSVRSRRCKAKRPQSSYSISYNSASIGQRKHIIRPYSNRSMLLSKSSVDVIFNQREGSLIK